MFQTLSTEIDTLGLSGGARARYRLHDRVSASARLDLGAARTSLRAHRQMAHTAADASWGGIATPPSGSTCSRSPARGSRSACAPSSATSPRRRRR